MEDLIMWVFFGLGALLEFYIWSLIACRYAPPSRPSEIAGICFMVILLGPVAFFVISMVSLIGLIVGFFEMVGRLIDKMFGY